MALGALGSASADARRNEKRSTTIAGPTGIPASVVRRGNPWGVPNAMLRSHFNHATDLPQAPRRMSVIVDQIQRREESAWMVDRNSLGLSWWNMVVVCSGTFAAIWGPFDSLLRTTHFAGAPDWLEYQVAFGPLLIVACVVGLLDMGVQMNTTAFGPYGSMRKDRLEVVLGYLSSFFAVDLLSSFPFYAVVGAAGYPRASSILVNLLALRAVRVERVVLHLDISIVFRLANIILLFSAAAHFAAVVFVRVAMDLDDTGWIADAGLVVSPDSLWEIYATALYMSFTLMTTVGFGDVHPTSVVEREITIVILVIGSVFYAFVFGMVFEIVKKMLERQLVLEARISTAASFVRHYQITGALRDKIFTYTRTLTQGGSDVTAQALGLPEHVQTEVLVHIHANLIKDMPLFENASFNFIRALVLRMTPEVVVRYDYIMVMHDLSDCMYFVSKGHLVVSLKNGAIVASLRNGSYFGEIALLTRAPRTVNVWAVETSTLLKLTSDAFDAVAENFPEYVKAISDKAYMRIAQLRQQAKKDAAAALPPAGNAAGDSPSPVADPELEASMLQRVVNAPKRYISRRLQSGNLAGDEEYDKHRAAQNHRRSLFSSMARFRSSIVDMRDSNGENPRMSMGRASAASAPSDTRHSQGGPTVAAALEPQRTVSAGDRPGPQVSDSSGASFGGSTEISFTNAGSRSFGGASAADDESSARATAGASTPADGRSQACTDADGQRFSGGIGEDLSVAALSPVHEAVSRQETWGSQRGDAVTGQAPGADSCAGAGSSSGRPQAPPAVQETDLVMRTTPRHRHASVDAIVDTRAIIKHVMKQRVAELIQLQEEHAEFAAKVAEDVTFALLSSGHELVRTDSWSEARTLASHPGPVAGQSSSPTVGAAGWGGAQPAQRLASGNPSHQRSRVQLLDQTLSGAAEDEDIIRKRESRRKAADHAKLKLMREMNEMTASEAEELATLSAADGMTMTL